MKCSTYQWRNIEREGTFFLGCSFSKCLNSCQSFTYSSVLTVGSGDMVPGDLLLFWYRACIVNSWVMVLLLLTSFSRLRSAPSFTFSSSLMAQSGFKDNDTDELRNVHQIQKDLDLSSWHTAHCSSPSLCSCCWVVNILLLL